MTNPFFAMDTGLHGKHATPEGRAALLAELGYAGSDLSGTGGVAEMLKAYDAKGLRLFALYIGVSIDADSKLDEAGLKKAAEALKGRDAWFWVAVSSRKYKCSDPAGDDDAAAVLGKLADLAAPFGVRVALYPHTGSWVERVEDAVRVAKKVDRKNIGATFNLCHFLQVDSAKNVEAALKAAAPSLFAVTISGADNDAKGWDKLIQTLDRGTFDVTRVLRTLKEAGYTGPIGLQSYGIKGDSQEILARSMEGWRKLTGRPASAPAAGKAPAGPVGVVAATSAPAASAPAGAKKIELLAGADFAAFRPATGDWKIVGEVSLDPKDDKKLAWKDGTGLAVNGSNGRTAHLLTRHEHGDCQAHVEFLVARESNSGVYFQGRYEVQILDSWGVKEPHSGDCGGIYERWKDNKGYDGHAPRVNASKKPGEWQTFDVTFRAPRFDAAGKKIANGCFVKVVHNGVVIHENAEVTGPTRSAAWEDEKPLGPIMFQGDHGPVAFRNCWIVDLAAAAAAAAAPAGGGK
jgi:sugar phosphate isomerase/epimerase